MKPTTEVYHPIAEVQLIPGDKVWDSFDGVPPTPIEEENDDRRRIYRSRRARLTAVMRGNLSDHLSASFLS